MYKPLLFLLLFLSTQVYSQVLKATFPKGYWQQHVDYTMDIDMDVKNFQYQGKQTLVYTNNSPETLDKVFYHLYFNAFQPESEMNARLQSIKDPDKRMVEIKGDKNNPNYESRISKLSDTEIGFINVHSLTQDGKPLNYHVEGTVLEVILATPILPDSKTTFEMEFTAQVPVQIRRSGRNNKEGIALSMAQWYPKIAEYDYEGWHTDPYIAREFYSVWGDYDITIHIDKDYMVAGTGYIQNPNSVGFGYEIDGMKVKKTKGNKKTWHFIAPNVHDFTWAADPDYTHDKLTTKNGTTLHFVYQKGEKMQEKWRKMQPLAVKAFDFLNDLIGPYPYKQYSVIQGGDGGMEYGMCTLVNGEKSFDSLLGTVVHEMGHAWFQFALATHEGKHPWMDEGFTTFVETLAMDYIAKEKDDFPFSGIYGGYFYMVSTGEEEPLITHSDRYKSNMSYGINAYYKGSVFMAQLGYIIGWENLLQTIKEYYVLWSGKHPDPVDFIRVAEAVSEMELDWYLNEFAQTTHVIDYGIKSVENNIITLERIGEMPMPIDLQITYQDGSTEHLYIPLNLTRGDKRGNHKILKDWGWGYPTYSITLEKTPTKVEIDASRLMADIDRDNNTWEAQKVKTKN